MQVLQGKLNHFDLRYYTATVDCPENENQDKKAFSTVATVIRIHLISYLDMY
jgi:hypothetical protein